MTELEWIDIFSGNLRDIMDEIGISQEELAKDTKLSKSVISNAVNGKTMPSLKTVINIIHVIPELENPLTDLIYFDDLIE